MSAHAYGAFCEEFYVNMRLGSQMALPNGRDTVLHFFERMQKQFPGMTRFKRTDSGDYNLEEDRSSPSYRWLSLESKRLSSGHVNPLSVQDSLDVHTAVLQGAPHFLSVSPLEIDYLDLLFGFDLEFNGNHDEIVAESLFRESPLACLADEEGARAVDFQPSVTVALSEDCRLQARIDVITRTSSYQVRTGDYSEDSISIYLVLRRYWGDRPRQPMEQILSEMADRAEGLCESHIVPKIIRPISSAIASRS